MIRKLSMAALLVMSGWVSTSNAALIGVCTFASGCGPDFNVSTVLSVDYTYNAGSNIGVLSIQSNVQDASFLDGQLDPSWAYGNISNNVISATGGDDKFTLNFSVDGSGNLLGSSNVTMNGRVFAYDASNGGQQTAKSYNGTALDGNLITGGSIDQIGWNNTALDFRGSIDATSLLTTAGYGGGLSGLLTLNSAMSSSTGYIKWDESWTSGGTLDVVVPVPAAVWLFASGLLALVSVSRRKSSI